MRRLTSTYLLLALLACSPRTLTGNTPPPASSAIRIVAFGPTVPFAVGADTLQFVGTLRNEGTAPTEAGVIGVRLLALAGLDYQEGDTAPRLPALAPGESVTYRWKLQPTGPDTALVASLAVLVPTQPPDIRLCPVQQLAAVPSFPESPATPLPSAKANGARASAQSDRLRLRIALSNAGVPILWLAAWNGTGWRTLAVSLPLAEALSAEGTQQPWWEVFRVDSMRASADKTAASLVLVGGIGVRWRATMTLTVRNGSGVAAVEAKIAPLRDMRLYGFRMTPLLDNRPDPRADQEGIRDTVGAFRVAAANRAEMTYGAMWPVSGPTSAWAVSDRQPLTGDPHGTLGAEASLGDQPLALASGAMVAIDSRVFAIPESADAADARRLVVGPALKAPSWAKAKPVPRTRQVRSHRRSSHRRSR